MNTEYFDSSSQSTTNTFDSISIALRASQVSYQARIFLAHIAMWAGQKGVAWWSTLKMAQHFGVSERTIQRWRSELERAGLLETVPRLGRSNLLYPLPEKTDFTNIADDLPEGTTHMVSPRKETSKTKTFEVVVDPPDVDISEPEALEPASANVFSQSAPEPGTETSVPPAPAKDPSRTRTHRTQEVESIVEEIEVITQDSHSRGAFIRIARNCEESIIFQALSIVRCGMADGSVRNPGAYFLSIVRALTGSEAKGGGNHAHHTQSRSESPWMTLRQIEQCWPHIKIQNLWEKYGELRPGADLDDFRLFVQRNHRQIWEQKLAYRR